MAKISELPDAAPLSGAELIPVVQDGVTRKTGAAGLQLNPATPEFVAAFWLNASGREEPLLAADLDVIVGDGGGGC